MVYIVFDEKGRPVDICGLRPSANENWNGREGWTKIRLIKLLPTRDF